MSEGLLKSSGNAVTDQPTWSPESLAPERIDALVKDLIPSDDIRAGRNFGVHVLDGNDPHSDIGRYVESQVFDEVFQNDLAVMKEQYSPYDGASTFLAVLDYEQQKPVGVVRIIRPSEAGLKSLNDLVAPLADNPWFKEGDTLEKRFEEIGNDPAHTADIGTMAVMPEYRSGHAEAGASASLYSSCVQWSLANDYNNWVTIVDKKIHDMMQAWGEPFTRFEGTDWASYLDSKASLPVHTELHSGLERVKQFDDNNAQNGQPTDIHGLYTRGANLDQMFVLPDFDNTVQ